MPVKTFQAKVLCEYPRVRDYLWATHRIFNECLPLIIKYMRWMELGSGGPLLGKFGKKRAEEFSAIYHDMMGLPYEGLGIRLFGQCKEHKDKGTVEEIESCAACKAKRQGRSQNAHGWMEAITDPRPKPRWGSSKGISEEVKKFILSIREEVRRGKCPPLFDRKRTFHVRGDELGLLRYLFDTAARRILNSEQNELTHQKYLEEAKNGFDDWKKRPSIKYGTFEAGPLREFQTYEEERTKHQAIIGYAPKEMIRIDGAMARGWRDIHDELLKDDKNNQHSNPEEVVKKYQSENPTQIGDINFLFWLTQRRHLWDWVSTMLKYNSYQRDIEQYSKKIQFTYPKPDHRPEWHELSDKSPGNMYDLQSLNPGVVDLAVFTPEEDYRKLLAIYNRKSKKQKKSLNLIDFDSLLPEGRELLETPLDLKKYLVQEDSIWEEVRGFFRNHLPLDLKQFCHVKVRLPFSPDRRLLENTRDFRKEDTSRGGHPTCQYDISLSQNGNLFTTMEFGTMRLMFKDLKKEKKPYLYLTANLDPVSIPQRMAKRQKNENETEGTEKSSKRKKRRDIPDGLRTLAIDLGQRFTACATICEYKGGKLSAPEVVKFIRVPGIELPNISQHLWERTQRQRKTSEILKRRIGKEDVSTRPAKGEEFAARLKDHIAAMKEDRAKKCANQTISLAVNNKVDQILFENLTGYRPDQEFGRFVNKRLMTWNRRTLVEWVKRIGELYGYTKWHVYEWVSPIYTSQICSHCGSFGARFLQVSKKQALRDLPADKGGKRRRGKPLGLIEDKRQTIRGGELFCCAECHLICNADYNASLNLHKRFLEIPDFTLDDTFKRYNSRKEGKERLYTYKDKVDIEGRDFFRYIADYVQRHLNQHFKQGDIPPARGWFKP